MPLPPPNSTPPHVSTTPSPTIHISPTSAVTGLFSFNFLSIILIAVLVGLAMMLLIIKLKSRRNVQLFDINARNADAIFLVVQKKTKKVILVPARYIATGLFIGNTSDNDIYIIAVKPDITPFYIHGINKPFYFAVGETTVFLTMNLYTLSDLATARIFSDKSFSELIADILSGSTQYTSNFVVGQYKLAITTDLSSVLDDYLISLQTSSAENIIHLLTSAGNEITNLQKISLAKQKLQTVLATNRTKLILALALTIPIILAFVYILLHIVGK